MGDVRIAAVDGTVFVRDEGGRLRRLVRIVVANEGAPRAVSIAADGIAGSPVEVPHGESEHEVFVDEPRVPARATFALKDASGAELDRSVADLAPARRWTVHVVQLSHHDVGYTSLPSTVLREHREWLDRAVDLADATRSYPEEARFRIVCEQAWSLDGYLKRARPARAERMRALVREGTVELTALFGNMTTELMGHEALARSVYHSARIARECGSEVVSAEHNDVPGFSWGLAEVLASFKVRIFCPGLPNYYAWGREGCPGFWDKAAIFGREGTPGAFRWESPSGARVLFWSGNSGCGGDCRPSLPGLGEGLAELDRCGYPYSILRWPVSGGARDNPPYVIGYAETVRDWNARWAWPRLISSTNAIFSDDFAREIERSGAELRVVRGDLPGQDYPVGAMSTAAATAANRRNHADVPAAEALATAAARLAGFDYPSGEIAEAYEDALWHDEHTWGHHFPCGPGAGASALEKAVHAHRAAALAHDVTSRAAAAIADSVRLGGEGLHCVVFNALGHARSGVVAAPLREIENCGSVMMEVPPGDGSAGPGHLRGVALGDRWHVHPPAEILDGRFDLVDRATGEAVPYEIVALASPLGPEPFAAERIGLGAGGKRYGFFERPAGLARDLVFTARDVPGVGYRTYALVPRADPPDFTSDFTPGVCASGNAIENESYRIGIDPRTGAVASIIEKDTGLELVDAGATHPFGTLVVRDPREGVERVSTCARVGEARAGPVRASVTVESSAPGHPRIETTVSLHAGQRRIDLAVAVLKDPTPLLEAHVAFPFRMKGGRFRYEGALGVLEPVTDFVPGAYSNRIAVQGWVCLADGERSILWSSLDSPVASLGRLWPNRTSPAHSCVAGENLADPPQAARDVSGGGVYSCVFASNFGTNFSVSQSGHAVFRYVIASRAGTVADGDAAAFGQDAATPISQIFTEPMERARSLASTGSLLEIERPAVRLLALKRAEDSRGMVMRLWNAGAQAVRTRVALARVEIAEIRVADVAERDTPEVIPHAGRSFEVDLPSRGLVTLRVT